MVQFTASLHNLVTSKKKKQNQKFFMAPQTRKFLATAAKGQLYNKKQKW